jgi:hypothetical protein
MTHPKSPCLSRHGIVKRRLSRFTGPVPDEASVRSRLSDLRQELEQVERMIKVLEWVSTPPMATRN